MITNAAMNRAEHGNVNPVVQHEIDFSPSAEERGQRISLPGKTDFVFFTRAAELRRKEESSADQPKPANGKIEKSGSQQKIHSIAPFLA